ncbi:MAG: DUF881 domain-containing protein [Sarcina sp.]
MKNSEINLFMFIAAIIFGVLVSINLGIVNGGNRKISIEEYQDAYEKRTKLLSEINILEKETKNLKAKVLELENNLSYSKKIEIIEKELEINKNLLGLTDVKGEGVILILEDGQEEKDEFVDSFIRRQRTIHDNDINELLNDIRSAGAQAISINDERINYNSSVYCAGQFLKIDKIVKTPAPFNIKIIGNQEKLKQELLSGESTLKRLGNRGIKVKMEFLGEIKIKSIR